MVVTSGKVIHNLIKIERLHKKTMKIYEKNRNEILNR